jgi:ribosomal-protein-alanine N-acetyltransferase
MSEVLPLVLLYGFNEMSLHRIEAKVAEDNAASIKLLLKNSFKMEGKHREDYLVEDHYEDSFIYALLSSDSKA